MEEILASIRKIISDDDTRLSPTVEKAAPDPAPEPQGQDDVDALLAGFDAPDAARSSVLELTGEMRTAESDRFEGADLDFIEPAADVDLPRHVPSERALASVRSATRREDRLTSAATDAAIANAFGSLTHTILAQNARTLDDLVQDMLRPMLKAWLDDNLPSLVERLVRAEIERVSRGR